jgi:hypothetical protein
VSLTHLGNLGSLRETQISKIATPNLSITFHTSSNPGNSDDENLIVCMYLIRYISRYTVTLAKTQNTVNPPS